MAHEKTTPSHVDLSPPSFRAHSRPFQQQPTPPSRQFFDVRRQHGYFQNYLTQSMPRTFPPQHPPYQQPSVFAAYYTQNPLKPPPSRGIANGHLHRLPPKQARVCLQTIQNHMVRPPAHPPPGMHSPPPKPPPPPPPVPVGQKHTDPCAPRIQNRSSLTAPSRSRSTPQQKAPTASVSPVLVYPRSPSPTCAPLSNLVTASQISKLTSSYTSSQSPRPCSSRPSAIKIKKEKPVTSIPQKQTKTRRLKPQLPTHRRASRASDGRKPKVKSFNASNTARGLGKVQMRRWSRLLKHKNSQCRKRPYSDEKTDVGPQPCAPVHFSSIQDSLSQIASMPLAASSMVPLPKRESEEIKPPPTRKQRVEHRRDIAESITKPRASLPLKLPQPAPSTHDIGILRTSEVARVQQKTHRRLQLFVLEMLRDHPLAEERDLRRHIVRSQCLERIKHVYDCFTDEIEAVSLNCDEFVKASFGKAIGFMVQPSERPWGCHLKHLDSLADHATRCLVDYISHCQYSVRAYAALQKEIINDSHASAQAKEFDSAATEDVTAATEVFELVFDVIYACALERVHHRISQK